MRTTSIIAALSLLVLACEASTSNVVPPTPGVGGAPGGGGSGGSGGAAIDAGQPQDAEVDASGDAPPTDGGCACPAAGCFFLTEAMRVCNPCEPNPQWSQHENVSCAERCCTSTNPGAIILTQQVCTWMHVTNACGEPFAGAGDFACKLFNGSTCGRCWTLGIQDNRCGVATPGCWMDGCSWVH